LHQVAGYIPDDKVDQVRSAADIVAVIRQYIPLKRAGRNFKALCPFHREKTPSFVVNPEKQTYHCFGCHVGGDVFSFVMKQEQMDFGEAIRLLADRCHVDLPSGGRGGARGPGREEKTRVYEVNLWAASTFHGWLVQGQAGAAARRYLEGRGISPEMVRRFRLGLTVNRGDALLRAATDKGLSESLLVKAGLALRGDEGRSAYDRFRNRLMFPIRDAQGRVLGFGGRTLGSGEPKYLNSPETPLFQKSKCLYGLDLAREALRERRRVVVMEGYTDVIMAHQHGVQWAVAVLGTALTPHHVRLLRRYVDEALLVFDADTAGQNSADRSVDAFVSGELAARVVTLPEGMDPCDFLLHHGREAFEQCLERASDVLDFKMDRSRAVMAEQGLAGALHSARALDEILSTVGLMPNPVARDAALRRVAAAAGVGMPALAARLDALRGRTRPREAEDKMPAPQRDIERELLEVVLEQGDLAPRVRDEAVPGMLRDPRVSALLERCSALSDEGVALDALALLARTQEPDLRPIVEGIMGEDLPRGDCVGRFEELVGRLRARQAEEAARPSLQELAKADDEATKMDLLRTFYEAKRRSHEARGQLHG